MSKYGAKRSYSNLCERWFSSRLEMARGEELFLLQYAGEITNLHYQVKFVLCKRPLITITIDFAYREKGQCIYEDTKGVLTRDFRTKLAWLKEKYDIEVILSK